MAEPCPVCGCTATTRMHAVVAALRDGDVDAALDAGLLDGLPCTTCSDACNAVLREAQDARRTAFAARDRFLARQARLARRQQEREARRTAARATPVEDAPIEDAPAPSLPPAAAAALARAKAKAAGRTPR